MRQMQVKSVMESRQIEGVVQPAKAGIGHLMLAAA